AFMLCSHSPECCAILSFKRLHHGRYRIRRRSLVVVPKGVGYGLLGPLTLATCAGLSEPTLDWLRDRVDSEPERAPKFGGFGKQSFVRSDRRTSIAAAALRVHRQFGHDALARHHAESAQRPRGVGPALAPHHEIERELRDSGQPWIIIPTT